MALLPALLAGAVFLSAGPRPAGDSILLRVLTTNDVHGALISRVQPWSNQRPVGGAAAVAGMMNRLSRACACVTVRLDAGDVMQGSAISNLSYGRATVEAFNAMGYAASAIGNHEFDWGIDTLAARVREARFAWLSANLRERATSRSPPWTAPWRMVTAGSLKIAVVGYSTEETPSTTRPSNVASLRFDEGAAHLDAAIAAARRERPDYVIVVAHAGAFCNRDQGCAGEVIDLARALRQSRRLDQENRLLREGMHKKLIAQSRAMAPVNRVSSRSCRNNSRRRKPIPHCSNSS
jgi:2',3'-cyclic-nucleotide 2'-phosphodiesterase (5'-nucleotidase family)